MYGFLSGRFQTKQLFTRVDIHSHLLPDIDDGSSSLEFSLEVIRKMCNMGYKKLVLTPHIMLKKYPNDIEIIKQALFELRSYVKVKNIDIEIEAAAEYYCDEHFVSLIQQQRLLSFGNKYILFELPYTKQSGVFEQVVELLITNGYIPVLAHPERYTFLKTVVDYRRLKNMGVYFQVNVNSLAGYYGAQAQKKALMLSQRGMIDFVGSDLHNKQQFQSFKEHVMGEQMVDLFEKNRVLNDTI